MYKFCFYVPESHLETVKKVVFDSGAGQVGDYDHCCWQALGQGQFRPLQGSKPFIGNIGTVQQVPEYRVEMVCDNARINAVIKAFLNAHPYEEPAYDVIDLADF